MFNNSEEIIKNFISKEDNKETDYLKRENSNFVYSLQLMRKNLCNHDEEKYLMKNIFSNTFAELCDDGVFHAHDRQLAPYCLSISCKDIATYGIPTLAKNMNASKPTKKFRKLMRHFSNTVTLMSQQVSGACMLSQMTTITASYLYYLEKEKNIKLPDEDIKEEIESLIWELNIPLRSGSESAFSNITMEFGKPSEEIKDEYVIIGGEIQDIKYRDIPVKYFDKINKAIIDVMAEGTGTIPFTFPLITIPIDDNFNFENKLFLYLLEKMYHFGGVYFENFTTKGFENEYYKNLNPLITPRDPEVSRSLCCRLQIDLSLLSKVGAGIFGSSTGNTGAVQVLNLNLVRVLMEFAHDKELLKLKIKEYFEIMQEGHLAKRKFIEENKHLYPTFFAFNKDLKNYFNVFAVSGMHEGLINIGYEGGLKNPEGKAYAHELMQYITEIVNEFIIRDKVACGLEYAPIEGASVTLGRKTKAWAERVGKTITLQGNEEDNYITSGCMLPFSENDFIQQIENSAEFQPYATSGSILHHFLESKVEPTKLANYIKNIFFNKPIIYMTMSPTLSCCMKCGQKFIAEDGINIEKCPVCGDDDLATFGRIIGYVRAISRKRLKVKNGTYEGKYNFWSKAKRHDWNGRRRFKDTDII